MARKIVSSLRALPIAGAFAVQATLPAAAAILFEDSGPYQVVSSTESLITAAPFARGDGDSGTLYFRYTVNPISDINDENYFAALELVGNGGGGLGIGNEWGPGDYSAFNTAVGGVQFNSATPEGGGNPWQWVRDTDTTTIVWRIDYNPGGNDQVTVWLNPDLSRSELEQDPLLITTFEANASFDALQLRHGNDALGWTFSDIQVADDSADFFLGGASLPTPTLTIARSGGDLVFTWESQEEKLYDLLSATDLATPPSTPWPAYDDGVSVTTDLAADPSGTNTLTVPFPGDPRRFFAVVEKDPPPPLDLVDFEGGVLPEGWSIVDQTGNGNTLWQVGNPDDPASPPGGPPTGAGGSTHCVGTNIIVNYQPEADVSLITPEVTIPAAGATLSFQQWRDTESVDASDDSGAIYVRDAGGNRLDPPLATAITGIDTAWDGSPSFDLSSYAGQTVTIEFRFTSDDDTAVFGGWYLDDIRVDAN